MKSIVIEIGIGIDLGTTNSSVAVIQQNEAQILKNSLEKKAPLQSYMLTEILT